ncbi:MAG: ferredoxin [Minisyncoccia bacterium]|jgi:ferredoxin
MANQVEYKRTKAGSKIAKIVVDKDLCIGAASCIAVAGTTFELGADNKVVVVASGGADAADDETLILAAESCPTKAILLFDAAGNQIYPK